MKIIEKNEGAKIPYEIKGDKIVFNDDELTLNLARYERDDANHIDICRDKCGNLVSGVIPGIAETYVAQIDIPARAYEEREIEGAAAEARAQADSEETGGAPGGMMDRQTMEREAVPFDINKCVLTLWALN